ncbi:uncharacterized protein LOC122848675 [Aphidius gifuensis]|uniref:uncharacterized protein LOC122848675 n=1 Tax=Aphidius gifuensis TaxID=684658 RepID=UPI001CDC5C13|nr:uncharacterized protein LOC122848675 [Aphidius gifuensis]
MGGTSVIRKTKHKLKAVSHKFDHSDRVSDSSLATCHCLEQNNYLSAFESFYIESPLLNDYFDFNNTFTDSGTLGIINNNHYNCNNKEFFTNDNQTSTMASKSKHRRENFDVNDHTGSNTNSNYRRYRRTKKRRGFVFVHQ